MPRTPGQLSIGTSGYQYAHWKARFYPEDLPKRRWFEYYAGRFDTVEINNTFYNLPKPQVFSQWHEAAPDGFEYALKFSRYGSHVKRLKDPDETIAHFLEPAGGLGATLGPILVQLPPNWRANPERLDDFLASAPRRHRWTFEFRDPTWLSDEIFTILANHDAALCIHDMIDDHPRRLTAGWSYRRYHGDHYSGRYSKQFLSAEAGRIAEVLAEGVDVYAYFNNDEHGHAVDNALTLKRLVGRRIKA